MSGVPKDVPFFDTNIYRVLHRLFFGSEVPQPRAKPKEVLALAADLVPAGEGWAWNQAVMEFGALHCTARKPRCEECPASDHCRAHPTISEALAGMPRAAKKEPGPTIENSNRYLRGRVLAQLREAGPDGGLDLREVDSGLRRNGTAAESSSLRSAVESLERDGLVRTAPVAGSGTASPGAAEAVAEERAAYGAEGDFLAGTWVSLP